MLNVKPILTSDSGEVRLQPIVRSMRQGINRIPATVRSRAGMVPVRLAVMRQYAG